MIFLVAVIAIIGFIYLNSRIENLERQVEALQAGHVSTSAQPTSPQVDQATPQAGVASGATPVVTPATAVPVATIDHSIHRTATVAGTPPVPPMNATSHDVIAWIKQDFLVKLGAFLLLIAFGWFVSYAFANNWIGPIGRITLGLLAGVGFMGLGVWRIQSFKHQGALFTVLGSTIVILTLYAARFIYDFFTPASALGLMFLSVVFVTFVSIRFERRSLATAGLILGALAPLLTAAPDPDVLGLSLYLLVLVLGSLWVVYQTGWAELTPTALLIMLLYNLPFISGYLTTSEDELIGLLFAFGFTSIFFLSNVASIVHGAKQETNVRGSHVLTAVMTGVFLVLWIVGVVPEEWHSLLYVAWMLVFSGGAFAIYLYANDRVPFYIYGAVSIGLLGAATAAELSGPALTIAYTLEAAGLVIMALLLLKDRLLAERMSFLFAVPIILSLESVFSNAWQTGVLHEDFFTLIILLLSLIVTSLTFFIFTNKEGMSLSDTAMALGIIGIVYFLTMVWLITHALLGDDIATFISLVIYTILGLLIYIRGRFQNSQALVVIGGSLLGLVVLRLLFIDVWQMELTGRIITFFAIGLLLISTAFIGRGKTDSPEQLS